MHSCLGKLLQMDKFLKYLLTDRRLYGISYFNCVPYKYWCFNYSCYPHLWNLLACLDCYIIGIDYLAKYDSLHTGKWRLCKEFRTCKPPEKPRPILGNSFLCGRGLCLLNLYFKVWGTTKVRKRNVARTLKSQNVNISWNINLKLSL